MTQVMVTIVAPLNPARIHAVEAELDRMGNPAIQAIRERLDKLDGDAGVHFMSLHAIPSFTAGRAHLILEFSADGDQARAIRQMTAAIGVELATVFAQADDWSGGDIGQYLTRHVIRTGFGYGDSPGVAHSGAPGMTVGRIRREATLAVRVGAMLGEQPGGWSALARLNDVRRQLGEDAPALDLAEAKPAWSETPMFGIALAGAVAFVTTYLWPFLALLAVWVLAGGVIAVERIGPPATKAEAFLYGVWHGLKTGVPLLIVVLIALGGFIYLRLRKLETTDWVASRAPDRTTLREIVARENIYAQNHMVSVTETKAGWLRGFTQRLAFWAVANIGPLVSRPGYLGPIGTIHFARWITPPGTRDLIFFSNYGGSWEAYLEDFITLVHPGLTAVWSNTVGFPRTESLFFEGATDGERFKRFARQSMRPTRFWYSAYPELICDMIRANAGIRRGLSGAMTEDDAATWLCYFGSSLRPDDVMITSEIQSLVFGGMSFLRHGALTLWRLPASVPAARRWLDAVSPHIAYSDGRRVRDSDKVEAIVQLAISKRGFEALGLPPDGLETFPPAFLDDMTADHRSRILGDVGESAPSNWWWGQEPADVAVIVYGQTEKAFKALRAELGGLCAQHGATHLHDVEMRTFHPADNLEPFGFADGGSQPVILGTYKGLKSGGDPMHLVQPGEFILGYPDNRGNLPPGPTMPALDDPDNVLPVLGDSSDFSLTSVNNPRELGRNGSFLVIRQLEQDPDAFNAYCDAEAGRLASRLSAPYRITPDFIAAKLVGRWRNNAPLVRSPYSQSEKPEIIGENSFQLGLEDPEGLRCPFGAHIRRANPRDSLDPGSLDQIAISNRHRLLRIGRKYQPERGQKPGLLFMALAGDIERQFEFVQQTWLNGNVISLSCPITLSGERDPFTAIDAAPDTDIDRKLRDSGVKPDTGFTIPTRDGPVKLSPMSRFVTTRGGGYFFLPGRRLVRYLSA